MSAALRLVDTSTWLGKELGNLWSMPPWHGTYFGVNRVRHETNRCWSACGRGEPFSATDLPALKRRLQILYRSVS